MTKPKVLVIEDNPDNLELVRFLVERAGYTAYTAHDGLEGWKITREQMPDLILLDLTIPEMDGWELARKIKQDPELSQICVVALTAHTLPGDRGRAMEAGCDGYLSKPLNVATFNDDLAQFLAKRGSDVG